MVEPNKDGPPVEDAKREPDGLRDREGALLGQNEGLRCFEGRGERSRNDLMDFYRLAPLGFLTVDASNSVIGANDAAARQFGTEPAELIGKEVSMLVPAASRKGLYEHLRSSVRDGAGSIELRMGRSGGPIFDARLTSHAVTVDGEACEIRIIVEDVTKSRRTERMLRESQEDLSLTQEVAGIGSWRLSLCSGKLVLSRQACSIFGVAERAPMTYERFLDIVHPEDRQHVDLMWRAALRGEDYDIEHRIIVGGEVRWVREKGILELRDGALHSGFGTVRDITESRRQQQRIEEERLHLQAILDNSPGAIIFVDSSARVLMTNRAAVELFRHPIPYGKDHTTHAVLRLSRPDGTPYDPRDLPLTRSALDGETFTGVEMEIAWPDGQMRYLLANTTPMFDVKQRLTGAVGTFLDISARKELEMQLKERAEELARSNEELQMFAYIASHDLQEPLRMVSTYITLLSKKYGDELSPNAREYMAYAVEGAGRMRNLVNDILQYSRVDTQGDEFTEVDLGRIVKEAIDSMPVVIKESKAIVTIGDLPTVQGDAVQLAQLFQNLLSNAIKFRGKEKPRIDISAERARREWLISIRDNGIGIDPRYQEKLFQMFQRLHTRDEYPGTGIGLALSKKIVERHGGRIWVESEEGHGSTFKFTMPVKR